MPDRATTPGRVYRVGPYPFVVPRAWEVTETIDDGETWALRLKAGSWVYLDFSVTRIPPGTPEQFLQNGRDGLPKCVTRAVERRLGDLQFRGERHEGGQFGAHSYAEFLWTRSAAHLIGVATLILLPPVLSEELEKVIPELPESFMGLVHAAIIAGGGHN